MLRRSMAVLALAVGGLLPAAAGPPDDVVDREMAAADVPGVAWAVVADGRPAEVGARGVTRVGTGEPVTGRTPFAAGSITKSITALAVMQLVEAGEVDLDAGVSRYLAEFAGGPGADVTVRELLSHTSGWSTYQGNTTDTGTGGVGGDLADRVVAVARTTPAHPAGERWEYSNTNYLVLGRLVEVVSGEDYATYVRTHVLEPVGMVDSSVTGGEVRPGSAVGHTPWFGTRRAVPDGGLDPAAAPAGGVVASAEDLARYLATMMDGEDDVLSADGKALMMRPASPASPFYGLGWFVDPAAGTVWHSGSVPGVETLATMVPARKAAVVVLTNGGSGVGFQETAPLRDGVTARALGLPEPVSDARLPQKGLFVGLVLLPLGYLGSIAWAWRHRAAIRAKSGAAGLFSLWFPLLTTGAAAGVVLVLVPRLMGAPLGTIRAFQPDLWLCLVATAVGGVLWAGVRLLVAYGSRAGRRSRDDDAAQGSGRRTGAADARDRAARERASSGSTGSSS